MQMLFCLARKRFQSTLPRRERRRRRRKQQTAQSNFNPRSREGSDVGRMYWLLLLQFQSTLPRRERPHLPELLRHDAPGFQSTLPRRERRQPEKASGYSLHHFNPRSREGSDNINQIIQFLTDLISIHAPAKGATVLTRFQSSSQKRFQSTLPRRERLYLASNFQKYKHFNPRSREGSDFTAIFYLLL